MFLRCKVHSVRHTYLFNFSLSKVICKKTKVNSEPTHFLTFMNNGKAFPSLNQMTCSYSAQAKFSFYEGTDKPRRIGFFKTFKNPIYQKIILITPGIIWSLKLKAKRTEEVLVLELLIPTLNEIVRYQFLLVLLKLYEQSSQNNQFTWCFPLKYESFFFKRSFSLGTNILVQKIYGLF